jgi:hypothetical protein
MSKISQLFRRAPVTRKVAATLEICAAVRGFGEAELDQVAAAGGSPQGGMGGGGNIAVWQPPQNMA